MGPVNETVAFETEPIVERLERDGFAIVTDVFDGPSCARVRDELLAKIGATIRRHAGEAAIARVAGGAAS